MTNNADLAAAASAAPAGLLHAVVRALGDPGSVVERRGIEPVPDWKARAVLEAVRPFVTALDDSDRPFVEEARRILAAFGESRLSFFASYDAIRALYDTGRELLRVLDKVAPKGESDGD